jgi:hypothetical protein
VPGVLWLNFHEIFFLDRVGEKRLKEQIVHLRGILCTLMRPHTSPLKRHQKIIDSLREKNTKLCEKVMAIDVEHTKNLTTQNLT